MALNFSRNYGKGFNVTRIYNEMGKSEDFVISDMTMKVRVMIMVMIAVLVMTVNYSNMLMNY